MPAGFAPSAAAPPESLTGPLPVFCVKLAQATVLTLGHAGPGCEQSMSCKYDVGRIAYLARQFAASGYMVVGMQETRTKGPCIRGMPEYSCVASGCTPSRQLGCELWLAREWSFTVAGARPGKVVIGLDDVCIAAFSHRMLLVTIRKAPHQHHLSCAACSVFLR